MKPIFNIIIFICILSMLSCVRTGGRRGGPVYNPDADIKATTNYELAHPVRRQPAPQKAPTPTYSESAESESQEESITEMQINEGSEG